MLTIERCDFSCTRFATLDAVIPVVRIYGVGECAPDYIYYYKSPEEIDAICKEFHRRYGCRIIATELVDEYDYLNV